MDVKQAYNIWADQYDTNINRTRDLEAIALRAVLDKFHVGHCLEIGCGTGKNTGYLLTKAKQVTAVDFSEGMLAKAREKIAVDHVSFVQADITSDWTFADKPYDLVTFSLVLEHIENLDDIFKKLSVVVNPGGLVYVGELHPYKQYAGTKARFDTESGQQTVTCFNHNISDFAISARLNNFEIIDLREFFDNNDKAVVPRIITFLLRKK